MDFLTIDLVKTHCRIDLYSEDPEEQRKIDETINKCAQEAEEFVYNYIGRDYADIIKIYGEIPTPIMHAALISTYELIRGVRSPDNDDALKAILKPYINKNKTNKRTMKVVIEIPKSAIKKAAYFLMSQTKKEEENETIDKAVEALEKEDCVNLQNEMLESIDPEADQMYKYFAAVALKAKVQEMEESPDEQRK